MSTTQAVRRPRQPSKALCRAAETALDRQLAEAIEQARAGIRPDLFGDWLFGAELLAIELGLVEGPPRRWRQFEAVVFGRTQKAA